jgi:uncharacterized protein (DUF433 family)
MSDVPYPHIDFDAKGVPLIAGTTTKVIEVVLDRIAYRWDADEIHRQHPHLSLAQIHAAFAYYYDHQAELDQDIETRFQKAQEFKVRFGSSIVQDKLRKMGRLP